MREEALLTTSVAASPTTCFEVASDVTSYPTWAPDLKEAEVLELDGGGNPRVVRFRAAAMGRSTSYTLRYDFTEAPRRIAWAQVDGDVTSALEGFWEFHPVDDPERTEIRYHLVVELAMPLPGFVKRRAETRIKHTALDDFADHVEMISSE